jgi:hypothetical protein
MTDTEREILREKDGEMQSGERVPYESARQATYEDSVLPDEDWGLDDS